MLTAKPKQKKTAWRVEGKYDDNIEIYFKKYDMERV
jgi:hypothetical protein